MTSRYSGPAQGTTPSRPAAISGTTVIAGSSAMPIPAITHCSTASTLAKVEIDGGRTPVSASVRRNTSR